MNWHFLKKGKSRRRKNDALASPRLEPSPLRWQGECSTTVLLPLANFPRFFFFAWAGSESAIIFAFTFNHFITELKRFYFLNSFSGLRFLISARNNHIFVWFLSLGSLFTIQTIRKITLNTLQIPKCEILFYKKTYF